MIDEIQVENLALIRHGVLQPAPGLTVLTGETGAGKTALLSACKLLMGERADKSAVREGASELVVSGRFYLTKPHGHASEAGHGTEGSAQSEEGDGGTDPDDAAPDEDDLPFDDELVAIRRVSADGRSRVNINGMMATVSQLHQWVAPGMDLCGQHEHQQLMKPSHHGMMLDAWAGASVAPARDRYQVAFREAQRAQAHLRDVQEASHSSSAQVDEARFILNRIDSVQIQDGEYESLQEDLQRAQHAETLAKAADQAYRSLADEGSAIDSVNEAISALDSAAAYDRQLAEYASALREASFTLEDVAVDARSYRDRVEFDPAQLEQQQERMATLQGLLRAYGPRMEDVMDARNRAAETVAAVDDSRQMLAEAESAVQQAESRLAQAAEELSAARSLAAPKFSEAVTQQMRRLEMGSAQLICDIAPLQRDRWTLAGPDAVEFLFAPGAGLQPRPLTRIASGGEISRVMLAIKVVLGAVDQVETLVFDEVDAGVGGATAIALAAVLADLATTHQVLVVTHLAQVAVQADRHYVVMRSKDAVPETQLKAVTGEDRVAEIARMLSGDTTQASLEHARQMLDAAAVGQSISRS